MKEKLKYAGIRALYTIGESIIGSIPASAVCLQDVNWLFVTSAAALAGILSFIKSMLVGMPEYKTDIIVDSERYE